MFRAAHQTYFEIYGSSIGVWNQFKSITSIKSIQSNQIKSNQTNQSIKSNPIKLHDICQSNQIKAHQVHLMNQIKSNQIKSMNQIIESNLEVGRFWAAHQTYFETYGSSIGVWNQLKSTTSSNVNLITSNHIKSNK